MVLRVTMSLRLIVAVGVRVKELKTIICEDVCVCVGKAVLGQLHVCVCVCVCVSECV